MKKQFFTFLMMIALVIVAGKAMAQSTYKDAYVGASHTYTIAGMQAADSWDFSVLTAGAPAPYGTPTAAAGANFEFVSGQTYNGAGSLTSAVAVVKWKVAGTYQLWLRVRNNTDGCYNYRYITVNVTDYPVQFNVLALMTGDENTTAASIIAFTGTASQTDCPKFVGEEFEFENAASNPISNGSTYAYYKVTRSLTSGTTSYSDWKFTPSTATTATITKWEYAYDAAGWADVTLGTEFTVDNNQATSVKHDVVYFRATIPNVVETTINVDLNIGDDSPASSTAYEVDGNIVDSTVGTDDVSTLGITPLPQIGGFSGN